MNVNVEIEFNGIKNEEEFRWAEKQFCKVNNIGAGICNICILPIYNFVWTALYPKDNMLDHPNYEKIYGKLSKAAFSIGTLIHGVNWKTKRKIIINPLGCLTKDYVFIKDL